MDKDEGSIGGLEKPPPATIKLYYASIFFDLTGLILSLFISYKLALLLIIYIGVSKAYSWHKIRLKKFPFLSWLTVMIFQGGYTFMIVNMAVQDNFSMIWFDNKNTMAFVIASVLVGGFYPLTQIYQHIEDKKRGYITFSYLLGVKGTFIFSAVFFLIGTVLFYFYFIHYFSLMHFFIFLTCLFPVAVYFLWWMMQSYIGNNSATFKNTMKLQQVAAITLTIAFITLFFINI